MKKFLKVASFLAIFLGIFFLSVVIFTVKADDITPTPTPYCSDSAPGGTPYLVSAEPVSQTQLKLTWNPASDPVSSYLVSYGLQSDNYIYGGIPIGGHDANNYTVNDLKPGTTYYFVIMAVNGCAPGGFSNEVSATTTGGQPANITTTQVTLIPTPRPVASAAGIPNNIGNTQLNVSTIPSVIPTLTQTKQSLNLVNTIFTIVCIVLIICIIIGIIIYLKKRNSNTYLPQRQVVTKPRISSSQETKEQLVENVKQKI